MNKEGKPYFGQSIELNYQNCELYFSNIAGTKNQTVYDCINSNVNQDELITNMEIPLLSVKVDVKDRLYDVWINYFFEEKFKSLSEEKVQAIRNTMPKLMVVEEFISGQEMVFYTIPEFLLNQWFLYAEMYYKNELTLSELEGWEKKYYVEIMIKDRLK